MSSAPPRPSGPLDFTIPARRLVVRRDGVDLLAAMATLVTPYHALTTAEVARAAAAHGSGADVLLLGSWSDSPLLMVHVAAIDPAAGVAVLEVDGEARVDVPRLPLAAETPPEAPWQVLYMPPAGEEIMLHGRFGSRERIGGTMRVTLNVETPGEFPAINGAPIISEGMLAGIVVADQPWSTLLARPWDEIARTRLAVEWLGVRETTGEVEPGPLDRDAVFARLGRGARQLMGRADATRRSAGERYVRTEDLAWACYRGADGTLARLARRAGYDEGAVAAALATRSGRTLPRDATPLELDMLPPFTRHASRAVQHARDAADRNGVEVVTSDYLLYGLTCVQGCSTAQALREMGITRTSMELATPPRAGYRSDVAEGEDLLGIGREVNALASVLAAREVEPPLSLGLFGDWGSGKSFFMNRLEARIRALAAAAADEGSTGAYCADVVQIRFNAWTFIDTDLWAGLTSELFCRLAGELERREDPAEQRARLLAAIPGARDVLENARQRRDVAQETLERTQEYIAQLERDDLQAREALAPRALLAAAVNEVARDPRAGKDLRRASETLGLDRLHDAAAGVQADLLESAGMLRWVKAFLQSLRAPGALRMWIWLAVGVAATIALVAWLSAADLGPARQLVLQATAVLVGIGGALAPWIERARKGVAWLRRAEESQQALIDQKKEAMLRERTAQREVIARELDEARGEVRKAEEVVGDLNRQLETLAYDRQMATFIRERSVSTDYTEHLGTIARVRRDLEQLSRLLCRANAERAGGSSARGTAPEVPRIDRIVLYIDDLDRCPEDRVVSVLQAVHLLLAFPLFVVVVAVDSRWLLHSLRQHSRVFRAVAPDEDDGLSEEERVHWRSTPLNYLEKIFQIPFTLRPMRNDGFAGLVDHMAGTIEGAAAPLGASADPAADASRGGAATASSDVAAPASAASRRPPPPVDLNRASLSITLGEREAMKALYPLIPSPRAAKRFVNVYRLIRAMIDDADRGAFVGTAEFAPCRCALLLLAILVGHPEQGTELLRALVAADPAQPFTEFLTAYRPADAEPKTGDVEATPAAEPKGEYAGWCQLFKDLDCVRGDFLPGWVTCGEFRRWAPDVARFSFHSGRVMAEFFESAARA